MDQLVKLRGTTMRVSAKNMITGNIKLQCPQPQGCSAEQRSLHGMWVQPADIHEYNNSHDYDYD